MLIILTSYHWDHTRQWVVVRLLLRSTADTFRNSPVSTLLSIFGPLWPACLVFKKRNCIRDCECSTKTNKVISVVLQHWLRFSILEPQTRIFSEKFIFKPIFFIFHLKNNTDKNGVFGICNTFLKKSLIVGLYFIKWSQSGASIGSANPSLACYLSCTVEVVAFLFYYPDPSQFFTAK